MSKPLMCEQVRGEIPVLNRAGRGVMHYLDSAATSLMPAEVLAAVAAYDARCRGNIGRGMHAFAECADAAYEGARAEVAASLGEAADEVIFTAGSTAGLNLLAQALGGELGRGDVVLLSLAEHHSNIVPWQIAAARRGFEVVFAAPDAAGGAGGADLMAQIAARKPKVVSIAHRTNVGGGVADIGAVRAAMAADAVLVVDGAQYVPHELPDLARCGADFYVFSGHKCYAPNGVGVLWGRRERLAALPAVVGGGGAVDRVTAAGYVAAPLPRRLEAGTPPVTPVVGLAAALRWHRRWLAAGAAAETARLAGRLRAELRRVSGVRMLFEAAEAALITNYELRITNRQNAPVDASALEEEAPLQAAGSGGGGGGVARQSADRESTESPPAHEACRQSTISSRGGQNPHYAGAAGKADYPPAPMAVAFVVAGGHPHDVCEVLAGRGVAARGGLLCAEPLFAHLGIGEGGVRLSVAPYNTDADIDAAVAAVAAAARLFG